MKKITQEEFDKIVENHQHWLNEDCESWEDMKADLRGTYLSGADLSGADLSGADLRYADLSRADLSGADLSGADLSGADLSGADLSGADLSGADLRYADLRYADLRYANLSGAKNIPFIPMACPDSGSFVGWKKCIFNLIIKLEIPAEARRSSATGRKCRCDKAKVLEIQNIDGTKAATDAALSMYDPRFKYHIGETVEVEDFCEDRFKECAAGIHFFVNRQEAVDYEI